MKAMTLCTAMLAGLILGCTAAPGRAPGKKKPKLLELTEADQGKIVKTAIGTLISVALAGNATTGYQWQVDKMQGNAVRENGKADYTQQKHDPELVGVGGTFLFHFKAAKAGSTKFKFVYVRPWETDKPPAKTFEVTIEVQKDPPQAEDHAGTP